MAEHTQWETKAANALTVELRGKEMTCAQLAERIGDKGLKIRNKLARGKFTAVFMLQGLTAISSTTLLL